MYFQNFFVKVVVHYYYSYYLLQLVEPDAHVHHSAWDSNSAALVVITNTTSFYNVLLMNHSFLTNGVWCCHSNLSFIWVDQQLASSSTLSPSEIFIRNGKHSLIACIQHCSMQQSCVCPTDCLLVALLVLSHLLLSLHPSANLNFACTCFILQTAN